MQVEDHIGTLADGRSPLLPRSTLQRSSDHQVRNIDTSGLIASTSCNLYRALLDNLGSDRLAKGQKLLTIYWPSGLRAGWLAVTGWKRLSAMRFLWTELNGLYRIHWNHRAVNFYRPS